MHPDAQVTEIPHTAPLKKGLPSMPGVCLENPCRQVAFVVLWKQKLMPANDL